jgi:hypothetical protein
MQLEKIPDTEITPRIASKIMFAGKAKKLLQLALDRMDDLFGGKGVTSTDAYRYLSKGAIDHINDTVALGKSIIMHPLDHGESSTWPTTSKKSCNIGCSSSYQAHRDQLDSKEADNRNSTLMALLENQFSASSGYSATEVYRFTEELQKASLCGMDSSEKFCRIVEEVSDIISVRLWQLLKQKLGFLQFLYVMRNTYLLGKGELFQLVLDGVLLLTDQQQQQSELLRGGGGAAEMDKLLNITVLRNAGKLVGLDDDSLEGLVQLRIRSADVQIDNFANVLARDIQLTGSAVFSTFPSVETITTGNNALHSNSTLVLSLTDSQNAEINNQSFAHVWSKYLMKRIDLQRPPVVSHADSSPMINRSTDAANKTNNVLYSVGSVYFTDQKYVIKGFNSAASFSCDWNSVFMWHRSNFAASSTAISHVLEMFSKVIIDFSGFSVNIIVLIFYDIPCSVFQG